MSSAQFDHVTVVKKSNVYFGGLCISHTVQFEDGTKKTLGVILPSEQALTLKRMCLNVWKLFRVNAVLKLPTVQKANYFVQGSHFMSQAIAYLKLRQMMCSITFAI
jgi:uncharacterized protein YaiE (UPF0345 family)